MHDRTIDAALHTLPTGVRPASEAVPVRGIDARWFWTLQVLGWGFYVGQKYLGGGISFPGTHIHLALVFFLSWGLHLFYRQVFRVRRRLRVEVLVIVITSLAGGVALIVLGDFFYRQAVSVTEPLPPLLTYLRQTFIHATSSYKGLPLLTWSAVYLLLVYWLDVERERQVSLEAQALSHQAQLEMLRNQLSPHFLFNALNSMSVLIREDPARAEQMVDELSEFLRYALASTKVQEATLADEVDVLRRYLAIQQIRFEEKLQVEWNVEDEVLDRPVPPFLLHPLVENAIKYGMHTSQLPLQLGISIQRNDGRLVLEVSNTGTWVSAEGRQVNGAGLGLEIVRRRLEQRYPNAHSFVVGERHGRVHAVIELPTAA